MRNIPTLQLNQIRSQAINELFDSSGLAASDFYLYRVGDTAGKYVNAK